MRFILVINYCIDVESPDAERDLKNLKELQAAINQSNLVNEYDIFFIPTDSNIKIFEKSPNEIEEIKLLAKEKIEMLSSIILSKKKKSKKDFLKKFFKFL